MPAPSGGRLRSDSLSRPENFWPLVVKGGLSECWLWMGKRNRDGYGVCGRIGAHRVSWALAHGSIPASQCVLHRCDNRPCVNPSHLFLGTRIDNTADRDAKGRTATGRRVSTAKLSPSQVSEIRQRYGSGGETHRSLGSVFGVDHTVIGDILRGKSWRSL